MSEYMVMLTGRCNLKCPYCFAADSMNNASDEITPEAFAKAVNFALSGVPKRGIGIIGGEPTLHSKFDALMESLISDDRVESVDIFTNGTTLLEHLPVFTNKKVYVLVNCNSPQMIGKHAMERVVRGIDALFSAGVPMERVGLGINIFRENDDYTYFLDLVDRYKMDSVRISVSVPTKAQAKTEDRFHFFNRFVKKTHDFVLEILDRGVVPIFDCNKIPPCLLKGEEAKILDRYQNNPEAMRAIQRSNYLNGLSRCTPSIVVDQNLKAIRCFILSEETKQSISDFSSFEELKAFYVNNVDNCIGYESDCLDCMDCQHREKKHCMGGCLVFKQSLCR